MMGEERDSESSTRLKNISDDLLSNNTNEEIKIILSQQGNVRENVGNTLAHKHVEGITLHFDQQITESNFVWRML